MSDVAPAYQPVLDHWFADGLQKGWPSANLIPRWFGGGAQEDALIATQFGPLVERALAGELTEWEAAPLSRLALIVLLDQFPRNLYRGQGKAFAGDARAQVLVQASLALGTDQTLPTVARVFFYMPLMHAENQNLQHECVSRFKHLIDNAPPTLRKDLQGNLKSAKEHCAIIERFGRFPHRNAALGRANTSAETEYLQDAPRFGQ